MIKEVTRSHIKMEVDGRSATIPGEMFFPPDGKMGFAIFMNEIKYWDHPHHLEITKIQIDAIISEIRKDFDRGGNVLELA